MCLRSSSAASPWQAMQMSTTASSDRSKRRCPMACVLVLVVRCCRTGFLTAAPCACRQSMHPAAAVRPGPNHRHRPRVHSSASLHPAQGLACRGCRPCAAEELPALQACRHLAGLATSPIASARPDARQDHCTDDTCCEHAHHETDHIVASPDRQRRREQRSAHW